MKVLICGSRNYSNEFLVRSVLTGLFNNIDEPFSVIEGGATGADSYASRWADQKILDARPYMVEHLRFNADWNKYGKSAGPIRNQQMLEEGKPDFVIGFSDDIKNSRGTKHMLTIAKKAGIKTILIGNFNVS